MFVVVYVCSSRFSDWIYKFVVVEFVVVEFVVVALATESIKL